MNNNLLPIHFAPLQDYTDAVYRLAHARIFGGIDTYYSPFVRVEHGEIRRKDARDISSKNNREGIHLIPQLIASQPDKLEQIITLFIENNYQEADINLGCPFPMLAKRHNGAGMLPYPDEVKDLLTAAIEKYHQHKAQGHRHDPGCPILRAPARRPAYPQRGVALSKGGHVSP